MLHIYVEMELNPEYNKSTTIKQIKKKKQKTI